MEELVNMIKDLISTFGFPIACVIVMWRKITDSDEKQSALLTQLMFTVQQLTEYIKGTNNRNE